MDKLRVELFKITFVATIWNGREVRQYGEYTMKVGVHKTGTEYGVRQPQEYLASDTCSHDFARDHR